MKRLRPQSTPVLALVLGLVAPGASPSAQPLPGPTLAIEDTMRTEVPEVVVRAPRVTLAEILQRVARGEARRDSLLRDMSFTFTLRLTSNKKDKDPDLLMENVRRVYKKKPGKVRSVLLRDYRKNEKDDENVRVTFSSSMSEEIVNFAFRPEALREYTYTIENRTIIGNRLIYTIRFKPRSSLDFENPSGRVWVDTNEFVIVRQELDFEKSPAPLFLKDISWMVIERQRVEGHWVVARAMARLKLTIPWPKIGSELDMSMLWSDYALNAGIDDALFEEKPLSAEPRP
jgi:outer membrane lipoprotein-sorting protein